MRPIGSITGTAPAGAGPVARDRPAPRSGRTAESAGGRALIAVAPLATSELSPTVSRRPSANFLTQLIATAQQVPQTRTRGRADPDVAVTRYRAAAAEISSPTGRRLVRSC